MTLFLLTNKECQNVIKKLFEFKDSDQNVSDKHSQISKSATKENTIVISNNNAYVNNSSVLLP